MAAPTKGREPIHPSSSLDTENPSSPSRRASDICEVHPKIVPEDSAVSEAETKKSKKYGKFLQNSLCAVSGTTTILTN